MRWGYMHGKYQPDESFGFEYRTGQALELVVAHLRIDKATFDAIPRDELVIVPG
jgi:hypothetical protein